MSLDLVITDKNKHPTNTVSVDVETHMTLVEKAKKLDMVLLLRLNDYYKDTKFDSDEIGMLSIEIEKLIVSFTDDKEVLGVLMLIRELCKQAKKKHEPIIVIAD